MDLAADCSTRYTAASALGMTSGQPPERRTSLARAVGPCLSAAISALLVSAHLMFCYGQLVGKVDDCPGFNNSQGCPADVADRPNSMMEVDVHAKLVYRAQGPLAALAAAVEQAACHTECPAGAEGLAAGAPPLCSKVSCDACSEVVDVTFSQHCTAEIQMPVAHMSYLYAVTQLWAQDASPLCQRGDEPTCTHTYPGRPASAVLVVFSFIWPHLKLILLHVFFYAPMTPMARRNGNYWLAFFGKWTLADVLVMTCLLGLLNIDVSSSLLSLWAEIQPDVPRLCSALCQPHPDDAFTPSLFTPDLFTPSLFTSGLFTPDGGLGAPAGIGGAAGGWDTGGGGAWPAAWGAAPHSNGGLLSLGMPGLGSSHALNCSSFCESVAGLLGRSVLSPSELPQSDLSATLRLRGLTCMYFFCVAVVLSLSISVLVDNLDDAHREQHARQEGISRAGMASLDAGAGAGGGVTANAGVGMGSGGAGGSMGGERTRRGRARARGGRVGGRLGAALLEAPMEGRATDARSQLASPIGACDARAGETCCDCEEACVCCAPMSVPAKTPATVLWRQGGREGMLHVLLITCQIGLTILAFSTPLFERKLTGSLSLLLQHYGFDFTGYYSMFELGLLSAAVGGWALIMSTTFWIFIIICPLVRGCTLLHLLLTPLTEPTARRLHAVSRAVSYYYAFEVMLVAVPLIGITIQPMTSSLFTDFNTPICKQINQAFPNPPGTDPPNLCFTINVVPSAGYWVVAAAVALFLVSGFDGSPTHKFIHRRLYPGDDPPPNLAVCAAQCSGTR